MHVAAVATATAAATTAATTTTANNGFTHACATDSCRSFSLLHLLPKRASSISSVPHQTAAEMQSPPPAADALLQFML